MRIKRIALGFALAGLLMLGLGLRAQQQGVTLKARPDLLVEKIEFSSVPAAGGAHQVTAFYTMYNDANVASRSCPTPAGEIAWKSNPVQNLMFEARLDVRDYPNGRFQNLATIQLELGAHGRLIGNGVTLVQAGKKVEFRATVDSQNWIDESNEGNNERKAVWPPMLIPAPVHK